MQKRKSNIVLIGMPGAGKSTLGVVLAKTLGMDFLDTDLVIQMRTGMKLQDIINTLGVEAFEKAEEESILSLQPSGTVIATGGSAVYSQKAMEHLGQDGVVVYLELEFAELEKRLGNIKTRGVVIRPGSSLRDVFEERKPLYEKYGEITVSCTGFDMEECVARLVDEIEKALL